MKFLCRFIILTIAIIGCEKQDPVKFINDSAKNFVENKEVRNPIILDEYGLMLFPIEQNYIRVDGKLNKIVTYSSYYSSSLGGSDLKESGIVNYYWRKISDADSSFKIMFEKDVLIIDSYDFYGIEDEIDTLKPAFTVLQVVDTDTDKNNIFDEKNDTKSLYIFNFITHAISKITPDSINVESVNYEGFIGGAFASSGSAGASFIVASELNESIMHANNYVILFEGISKADTNTYLYHLKNEYLENISTQLYKIKS